MKPPKRKPTPRPFIVRRRRTKRAVRAMCPYSWEAGVGPSKRSTTQLTICTNLATHEVLRPDGTNVTYGACQWHAHLANRVPAEPAPEG